MNPIDRPSRRERPRRRRRARARSTATARASSSRVARRRRHRARTHDRPVRRGAVLELYRHAFVGEFLQKPHELHGVASPSSVVDARRARDVRATASVRVRVLEPRSFSGARVGARGKARRRVRRNENPKSRIAPAATAPSEPGRARRARRRGGARWRKCEEI